MGLIVADSGCGYKYTKEQLDKEWTVTRADKTVVPINDDKIPEGSRVNSLMGMGGYLRSRGYERNQLAEALIRFNLQRCSPPLEEKEVSSVINSCCKYPAGVDLSLTDWGNAKRLRNRIKGKMLWDNSRGLWWFFKNGVWRQDQISTHLYKYVDRVLRDILEQAALQRNKDDRKALAAHSEKSASRQRMDAMIELCKPLPGISVSAAKFDSDPYLLALSNCVVNLKTLETRQGTPDEYLTKSVQIEFDQDAKCPQWIRFLGDTFDPENVGFIQRALGYTLTGVTREHVLFFLYGTGANGKTTFINVLLKLCGDYAKNTLTHELMVSKYANNSTNHLARLVGARLVVGSEVDSGSQLAESLIKTMTGGDAITCRYLYKESFEYYPNFKLWLTGNHKPIIRGSDEGIWRRIVLIPFLYTVSPKDRNPQLYSLLEAEMSGILNWALEGAAKYFDEGLGIPDSIRAATAEYRGEMDIISQWFEECCTRKPGHLTSNKELYESYKTWAEDNEQWCPKKNTFLSKVESLGFRRVRQSSERGFSGISINSCHDAR